MPNSTPVRWVGLCRNVAGGIDLYGSHISTKHTAADRGCGAYVMIATVARGHFGRHSEVRGHQGAGAAAV